MRDLQRIGWFFVVAGFLAFIFELLQLWSYWRLTRLMAQHPEWSEPRGGAASESADSQL
jgi:hypothetical protein